MKYEVPTRVENAEGTQTWLVEADSPEDAIARVKRGEGVFLRDEIEVTEISYPEPDEVEEHHE